MCGVIDQLLTKACEFARLCGGDMNMNQQIQIEEERNMGMRVETNAVERDQLAQWGFSTEEIVALFWLRRWYQTGGSDRVPMCAIWSSSSFSS
jgi:hypothetical protein